LGSFLEDLANAKSEVGMRVVICLVLGICGFALPAEAQQQPAQATPVGVVTAERKPIAKGLDFVGRVEAIERVEIRARITGYLEKMMFKEGDFIKKGAPLYEIEKGLFLADVQRAQGALERSKASKLLTEVQLQRAQELLARNAGTVVTRDQAVAADQQAEAAILTDQANLETAKINLGYTDITAPINGRVSRTTLTNGNVVTPQSQPLTVLVSQDPMYVTFPVSQREFLRAQKAGGEIDLKTIKARIKFADDSVYRHQGAINFVDVSVDRATDTVLVRATFPNRESQLTDGQLVRVELEAGTPEDKVVIPQSALIADQEGVYVFVVDDGKAAIRRVKPAGESGTGVIIEQGLSGGELVVVEGLQSLRAGVPVRASPVPQTLGKS
jgi:membrane fusion protein (multidrug efflux system)